ncbi:MAG TPA: hypothetical protein VF069_07355 [Streptosporangiaceae bacterium]
MIFSRRRACGARGIAVAAATALIGVVPLFGCGNSARADGPVGSASARHAHRGGPPYRHRHPRVRLVATTTRPAGPVLPGRTYTWPFAVTNKGSASARGVTFVASLSKSLSFVSGQQNCSWRRRAVVCRLGEIKPGRTKAGVVTAKVAPQARAGRPISARGHLTWSHSRWANRTMVTFHDVKVAEITDVAVTQTGPRRARPGRAIPYKVTVTNHGTVPARLVVLRDTAAVASRAAAACVGTAPLPAAASGRKEAVRKAARKETGRKETAHKEAGRTGSAAPACRGRRGPAVTAPSIRLAKGGVRCKGAGVAAGGGLVCALGTLPPGASKSLVVMVRPKAKPGAVVRTPARVSSATIDIVGANNIAVATTRVIAPRLARSRAADRSLAAAPGRVPGNGLTRLPNTGAPALALTDVALALIGIGFVLCRLGRTQGR